MAPGMRRSKAEAGKRRRTLALETLESQVSRAKTQPRVSLTAEQYSSSHNAYRNTALRFHRCARARLLEPTKTPPWTPATTSSAARASN